MNESVEAIDADEIRAVESDFVSRPSTSSHPDNEEQGCHLLPATASSSELEPSTTLPPEYEEHGCADILPTITSSESRPPTPFPADYEEHAGSNISLPTTTSSESRPPTPFPADYEEHAGSNISLPTTTLSESRPPATVPEDHEEQGGHLLPTTTSTSSELKSPTTSSPDHIVDEQEPPTTSSTPDDGEYGCNVLPQNLQAVQPTESYESPTTTSSDLEFSSTTSPSSSDEQGCNSLPAAIAADQCSVAEKQQDEGLLQNLQVVQLTESYESQTAESKREIDKQKRLKAEAESQNRKLVLLLVEADAKLKMERKLRKQAQDASEYSERAREVAVKNLKSTYEEKVTKLKTSLQEASHSTAVAEGERDAARTALANCQANIEVQLRSLMIERDDARLELINHQRAAVLFQGIPSGLLVSAGAHVAPNQIIPSGLNNIHHHPPAPQHQLPVPQFHQGMGLQVLPPDLVNHIVTATNLQQLNANATTAGPPGLPIECKCTGITSTPTLNLNAAPCPKHQLPNTIDKYEFHHGHLGMGFGIIFQARVKTQFGGDDKRNQFNKEVELYNQLSGQAFIPKFLGVAVDIPRKLGCFLMDYVPGGDFYNRIKYCQFGIPDDEVLFNAAVLVHAVSSMHEASIIHRDIKPCNILIDKKGYPNLVDFGLAINTRISYQQRVGTAPYMAPEIIQGYVMFSQFNPFPFGIQHTDTPEDAVDKINNNPLVFSSSVNVAADAQDLIRGLLEIDVKTRLDFAKQIKSHPYFTSIDWDELERRELVAPFVPTLPRKFEDAGTLVQELFDELAAQGVPRP
ncbi:hypothetical protein HDU76_001715 [Blyttiomyces sp. JEL0837]|nr:hypothetical protein HDU76_001715 [Blyttiomyces sp. JEL0837]